MALKKFKSRTIKIFEWFHNSYLKSNSGKCNGIRRSTSPVEFQTENTIISSFIRDRLLDTYIDGKSVRELVKTYTLYLGYLIIWMQINE